jgi:hypothetical protein
LLQPYDKIVDGLVEQQWTELFSKSTVFYDADMIAGIINAMLYHRKEHSTVAFIGISFISFEHINWVWLKV